MRLEGSIEERPLTSVLQVLGTRGATGRLLVERGSAMQERLQIDFRSGLVVRTWSKLRPPDLRIGQLIVKGGYAKEDQLGSALEKAERLRRLVGEVMVSDGHLDGVVLSELLQLQMAEDLFDAIRWKRGTFRFEEREVEAHRNPPSPITPRDFLSACLKHIDRWGEVEHLIPDRGVAFARAIDGPIPEQEIVSHRLTPQDVKIFGMVHPSRTVAVLLPLVRIPSYELYAALLRLTSARVIERHYGNTFEELPSAEVDSDEDGSGFTRVRVRKTNARSLKQSIAFHGATVAILVGLLGVGIAAFLTQRPEPVGAAAEGGSLVVTSADRDPVREALVRYQLDKIRNALRTYQLAHGELPLKLDGLVEQGLLAADDLRYPGFERPYVYRPDGDGYLLIRPKK